jgi:hypothetical protein
MMADDDSSSLADQIPSQQTSQSAAAEICGHKRSWAKKKVGE